MKAVRRILVPLDFSEPASGALDMAIDLAGRFHAELILFHAHQLPTYAFPDGVMPLQPEVLHELEQSMLAELERLAGRARAAGVQVSTHTSLGTAADEIVRYAHECGADLIVMGTHGRTGLRHVLIGSVAEKVVRKADCPVLTVGPHGREEARPVG
jgi:nucleotide-binding universal stress UspA family protein